MLSRLTTIAGLAGTLCLLLAPGSHAQTVRHVNGARLWESLETLSTFGRPAGGPFADGVTRIGFSESDLEARAWLAQARRDAGLVVRIDSAGNMFGRRSGQENLPVLLFGSHIDSVPHGGNFDGDAGVLGALETLRALNEQHQQTRHPLEMVVWSNEEGQHFDRGLLGSSAAAGLLSAEVLERKDSDGLT